ncbi:hypothetical protein [Winogradskyella sp.]|uniref:hypothetical protein n=1 Tax=Winogradskyella sp. TaxID=1883156 RepID=UPI003AA9AB9D
MTLLTMIIRTHLETNLSFVLAAILIILTMAFGYKHLDLHHKDFAYEKLSYVLWVPVGAVLCYVLNVTCGLGSILALGIVGTCASFLPALNKDSLYLKQIPISIYCGAFVGMSSIETSPSILFVFAAGCLAGLLLMISKNLYLGVGGKLGTMAFGGVISSSLIYWLVV